MNGIFSISSTSFSGPYKTISLIYNELRGSLNIWMESIRDFTQFCSTFIKITWQNVVARPTVLLKRICSQVCSRNCTGTHGFLNTMHFQLVNKPKAELVWTTPCKLRLNTVFNIKTYIDQSHSDLEGPFTLLCLQMCKPG